jgi:hypothetical protein
LDFLKDATGERRRRGGRELGEVIVQQVRLSCSYDDLTSLVQSVPRSSERRGKKKDGRESSPCRLRR